MVYRYFATMLSSQRWLERMNGMTTKHIAEEALKTREASSDSGN
jgi:hypothetical protein